MEKLEKTISKINKYRKWSSNYKILGNIALVIMIIAAGLDVWFANIEYIESIFNLVILFILPLFLLVVGVVSIILSIIFEDKMNKEILNLKNDCLYLKLKDTSYYEFVYFIDPFGATFVRGPDLGDRVVIIAIPSNHKVIAIRIEKEVYNKIFEII